ncbi:MAG TPA: bifunctional phosphoribosylaminoimidazolecarboxamide formyltransferase/IMP cyclohydrolase [Puia sp.]|nr:bifunctional phosphoribosylaminoimidazolecarboxamide formyltransferase/IMP cyclohydrolase [Puia sp.]
MTTKIKSALISVFYKEGLESIVRKLHGLGITIYSTGGTQKFIEQLQIPSIAVESLTSYPSILGGRVKTLHPAVFGGILGRRENEMDRKEMDQYNIPEIDLVIVDLYPFEETLNKTGEEKLIIEKIDIGGVSLIRAAAKNYNDVLIVASPKNYSDLDNLLDEKKGTTSLEDRRSFAAKAFEVCAQYDIAISNYFNPGNIIPLLDSENKTPLRYGENPHQEAAFYGDLKKVFIQLNGKEISYNNLVDSEAAIQLINEFDETTFAIVKHTNVCGIASRKTVLDCWKNALAGDPESAFGGVLVCNGTIDSATAEAISELFFEVLIAKEFAEDALSILKLKKNRILLQYNTNKKMDIIGYKSLLGGTLMQNKDIGNYTEWKEVGGRETNDSEKADLIFANIVCKHLKSNAIALVKNKQLIGKGCGQTSRIDALRNAIEKAKQFSFDLHEAAMASDAFFPFDDCVRIAHAEGIASFIQPGGSVRDKDSIDFCVKNNLAMVITGMRHFRH